MVLSVRSVREGGGTVRIFLLYNRFTSVWMVKETSQCPITDNYHDQIVHTCVYTTFFFNEIRVKKKKVRYCCDTDWYLVLCLSHRAEESLE